MFGLCKAWASNDSETIIIPYPPINSVAGCSKSECPTEGIRKPRGRLRVADNDFEACHGLTAPGGIHYLPQNSNRGQNIATRATKQCPAWTAVLGSHAFESAHDQDYDNCRIDSAKLRH